MEATKKLNGKAVAKWFSNNAIIVMMLAVSLIVGYMQPAQLRRFCQLDEDSTVLMKQAFDALGMTARSYDRVLKVARTIADLAGSESIRPEHIAEAVQYRSFQLGGENAR